MGEEDRRRKGDGDWGKEKGDKEREGRNKEFFIVFCIFLHLGLLPMS